MQWSNEFATTLEKNLSELLSLGRQMLAALMEEYDALYQREPPATELIAQKADLAQKLVHAQEAYLAHKAQLGDLELRSTLETQAPQLIALFDDTKSMLQQCDRHNQINGRLLTRTHIKNQLFGRLLKSHLPEPTYSRGGQLTENSGVTLGKA